MDSVTRLQFCFRNNYFMYLQRAISYTHLQTQILNAAIENCESETQRNTDEFTKAEHNCDKMLAYLNMLEKPINAKIQEIREISKACLLIEKEKELIDAFGEDDEIKLNNAIAQLQWCLTGHETFL